MFVSSPYLFKPIEGFKITGHKCSPLRDAIQPSRWTLSMPYRVIVHVRQLGPDKIVSIFSTDEGRGEEKKQLFLTYASLVQNAERLQQKHTSLARTLESDGTTGLDNVHLL